MGGLSFRPTAGADREGTSLTETAPICRHWPSTCEALIEEQLHLAALDPEPRRFEPGSRVGGSSSASPAAAAA
jgi:hypothetical protein